MAFFHQCARSGNCNVLAAFSLVGVLTILVNYFSLVGVLTILVNHDKMYVSR